jgi:hypothetical protein
MKLKPAIRLRSRRSRLVALAAATTTVVSIAGLAASVPAAHADPTVIYNTVGSDTVQDVWNGVSGDLGSNEVGSWNAVSPVSAVAHENIAYTDGHSGAQCDFTRPNGSTEGKNAFRKSINPSTTATQLTIAPQQNCIDFSRSSAGPATADVSPTGALVYIPFAEDALAGATGPATGTGATALTTAGDFTLNDLKTLYVSGGTVTEGGVTYNPQTATTGQVQINLYLPQSGSGTLAFWESTLGITTLQSWDHQTIVAGPNFGTAVEEHNGLATTDPNGYMPFSIAQWIAQSNGIDDRRHGAVLQNIGGVTPCVGGACPASGGSLNTGFPIVREVYNIAQFDHVVNTGDGNFDPALAALLAGSNSALCQDQFTILNYGFGLLPGPTTGVNDPCGTTSNPALRAFNPTTDPV